MTAAQGGTCPKCGKPLDPKEAHGHHLTRHADGGRTRVEEGAALHKECHIDLHRKSC